MKKNVFIVILVIIVLGMGGYLVYDKVLSKDEVKKDRVEKKDVVKEEKEKTSYNNLQKISLTVNDSAHISQLKRKKLDLEIVDSKLQAKLNYEDIDIKGLEGNIKSFIYNLAGCSEDSEMYIIALNDNNDLFIADVNHYDRNDYLTFKKISLKEKINDITELEFDIGFSTCGTNRMAVVLTDNTIHPLNYVEKNEFAVSTADVTNFKSSIGHDYIIYKDNTIGIFDTYGKYGSEFNERLKYNNEELHVDAFLNSNDYSYIISNNKLYKLEETFDQVQLKDVKVSLVNDKRIVSNNIFDVIMYAGEIKEFYDYGDGIDKTITFEDGSTFTIEKITTVYNNKI